MNETHKEVQARLESTLVYHLHPYFLSIVALPEETPPHYQILVSAHIFKGMSIQDRITYIFDLIKCENSDILENNAIIIEAYSASELEDLIEYTLI